MADDNEQFESDRRSSLDDDGFLILEGRSPVPPSSGTDLSQSQPSVNLLSSVPDLKEHLESLPLLHSGLLDEGTVSSTTKGKLSEASTLGDSAAGSEDRHGSLTSECAQASLIASVHEALDKRLKDAVETVLETSNTEIKHFKEEQTEEVTKLRGELKRTQESRDAAIQALEKRVFAYQSRSRVVMLSCAVGITFSLVLSLVVLFAYPAPHVPVTPTLSLNQVKTSDPLTALQAVGTVQTALAELQSMMRMSRAVDSEARAAAYDRVSVLERTVRALQLNVTALQQRVSDLEARPIAQPTPPTTTGQPAATKPKYPCYDDTVTTGVSVPWWQALMRGAPEPGCEYKGTQGELPGENAKALPKSGISGAALAIQKGLVAHTQLLRDTLSNVANTVGRGVSCSGQAVQRALNKAGKQLVNVVPGLMALVNRTSFPPAVFSTEIKPHSSNYRAEKTEHSTEVAHPEASIPPAQQTSPCESLYAENQHLHDQIMTLRADLRSALKRQCCACADVKPAVSGQATTDKMQHQTLPGSTGSASQSLPMAHEKVEAVTSSEAAAVTLLEDNNELVCTQATPIERILCLRGEIQRLNAAVVAEQMEADKLEADVSECKARNNDLFTEMETLKADCAKHVKRSKRWWHRKH